MLEELPERDQIDILAGWTPSGPPTCWRRWTPTTPPTCCTELPAEQAEALLALMEPEEAAPVRRLLTYAEDTAGGMMTSEPVILPPDATVAEALARIRQPELTPALAAQVYVCRPPSATPDRPLPRRWPTSSGCCASRRPPWSAASSTPTSTRCGPSPPLNEVTRYLATYNLVAVPVVDEDGRLVGAVTVDDVLDHLLPEDWRERGRDVA